MNLSLVYSRLFLFTCAVFAAGVAFQGASALAEKAAAKKAAVVTVAPPNAQLADPKLNQRVEELLKKMTLEEKAGQLMQFSAGAPTGPGTGRTNYEDGIAKGQIGSLLNAVGA